MQTLEPSWSNKNKPIPSTTILSSDDDDDDDDYEDNNII